MNDKTFWDSNLWVYLFLKSDHPDDERKRQRLLEMLHQRPELISSVQVLHEVGNALMRKYNYSESDVRDFLQRILLLTENRPISFEISFMALDLKTRYQFGWYDSIIVASALDAGCTLLYSEDMNHGLVVEGTLQIVNPFF